MDLFLVSRNMIVTSLSPSSTALCLNLFALGRTDSTSSLKQIFFSSLVLNSMQSVTCRTRLGDEGKSLKQVEKPNECSYLQTGGLHNIVKPLTSYHALWGDLDYGSPWKEEMISLTLKAGSLQRHGGRSCRHKDRSIGWKWIGSDICI